MSTALDGFESPVDALDEPLPDGVDASSETPVDDAAERRQSRRNLFKVGLGIAAGASLIPTKRAAAQRVQRPRSPVLKPAVGSQPTDASLLVRLVNRVTFGATEADVKMAKKLGFTGYLNSQLKASSIDDSAVETFIGLNYPMVGMDGQTLYTQNQTTAIQQLQMATLYRAAFSKRQLYERMVEFWTDHFSIYINKVNYLKLLDDREVIRKHALGKFPDMLKASAHSPAMLAYLDNTQSRGRNTNQNYAREIMELHTLGVDGGYTQQDVAELSRILTGWTIQGRGQFFFDPSGHDFGAKTWLGQSFPSMATSAGAAAQQEGETALNVLVAHPNTAKYVSKKMARFLLQYDPPQSLVDAVAGVYTKTNGDIPSMIRAILTPANLQAAPQKYKRPFHLIASSMRATQPSIKALANFNRWLTTTGQSPFMWETPDGYPDAVEYWGANVLTRWNYGSFLANLTNASGEAYLDVTPLMTTAATSTTIVDSLAVSAFGGEMPAKLRTGITSYLNAGAITAARVREAIQLVVSSSEFQWY
jgi:uncharacterized protein (DUF1800 family)